MNHCLFKAKDTKGAVGNTVDYSSLTRYMSMNMFARHVVQKTLMEILRRYAITSARCAGRQSIKKSRT